MILNNESYSLGHLTYCSNIHPAEDWVGVFNKLKKHLPQIKKEVSPNQSFGLGLRISNLAANDLKNEKYLNEFKDFLKDGDYYVFTLNGFPYGNFHGKPVKEGAYKPDWSKDDRLIYTNLLANHLEKLLPDNIQEGSISTVPGSYKPWTYGTKGKSIINKITENLIKHVSHLIYIYNKTGKKISLALEPEPSCFLETIKETVNYFNEELFSDNAIELLSKLTKLNKVQSEEALRFHLGVCYDVCHAAVEFENPKESINILKNQGIRIPKLQLSSAVKIKKIDKNTHELLKPLNEPVYMHQVVQKNNDGVLLRFPDLSDAFHQMDKSYGLEWRIHFHVPIFREKMKLFDTTQGFLKDILKLHKNSPISDHLEVETYTWDVLPENFRNISVSSAISRELNWIKRQLF